MRLFARRGGRQIGNVLALAVVAVIVGPVSPVQATAPGSVLGAYTGYGNAAADRAVGTRLGHPLTFGSDYIPYTAGWAGMIDPRLEALWAHSGLRMVYGLPMFPASCGMSSAACWNAGAAGHYSAYFSQIARNLVSNGQGNAILRLGWEFNVPKGYAWYAGGYAPQFVRYWQDIVTAMRAVPAPASPSTGTPTSALPSAAWPAITRVMLTSVRSGSTSTTWPGGRIRARGLSGTTS